MVDFVRKATKKSLLTMLRKADKITPRLLAKLFDGVLFKDEYETFSGAGGVDHGSLGGLADDDHVRYVDIDGTRGLTADWDAGPHEIRAETLESDVATGTAPLTVASTTLVDNLNADTVDGTEAADMDYDFVSGNDSDTDITADELEELTDGSETSLHKHAITSDVVCLSSYIDVKERQSIWDLHGGLVELDTASALDSSPTDISVTAGIGKLVIVINAGSDYDGEITVTGTTVDRNTGAETAADTDTITVDALTTDASDTDAQGNVRWSFTGAYITAKWFKGAVTLSTTNLTLTDVDTYQVAFEQANDSPDAEMTTADMTAVATNSAAWMYAYLYLLEVTGDKCDITRKGSLELPTADVSADKFYRIRRGNLGMTFDGTTDGFWAEVIPGPLNQNYWEDVNVKFWITVDSSGTEQGTENIDSLSVDGTVTAAERTTNFTMTNDESVVFVSFWAKFSGLDSSDQCMLEFYEGGLYPRYKVWWDVSAKNFVLEFRTSSTEVSTNFASTLLPSTLRDGSDYPVDDTWMHLMFTCHDVTSYLWVNGVAVGQGTGGGVPTTAAITLMNCVVGSARTNLPMASGSGIAQLRFHKGWTDGAAFYSHETRWETDMDATEETELWLGWPLTSDGVEITGSGIDLSVDGGTYGADGLKLY